MIQKTNIRWGVIGCGNVTEKKSVPAYQKTEGFSVQAVMSRNMAKAKSYALRHNIPKFYGNADDLIHDPEVDAVYIATPPDSHLHYALKVAAAGKPCCIEKPMAVDFDECQRINKAFEEKALPLFIAYYRRSLPRFVKIKEWIEQGLIGELRSIRWNYSRPAGETDLSGKYNWRTDATIVKGGYFDDLASHGLDLFGFLLGDITEAKGISANLGGLYTAKDAVSAAWQHRSGVLGSGNWNFNSFERSDKVWIDGNKGQIRFSVFGEEPIEADHILGKESLFIENPENIQLYHAGNMLESLRNEAAHPSTGKSGAETSRIMEMILRG